MTNDSGRKFEYVVFTCTIFLIAFGLMVLYSASSVQSMRIYENSVYFFLRQLIFCGIGIVVALFISFVPYKVYTAPSKYLYLSILMLVILTTFSGRISRGASRWIQLRGIVFQPSELMKLALILYLSKVLVEIKGNFEKKDNFLRVMLVAYAPTFIIALANLSTGIIMFVIATTLIFIVSRKKLIFLFLDVLIVLFYMFAYPMSNVLYTAGLLKSYQVGRIFAWKEPENYPDVAYQTLQGLYAIGSGKLFGRGYLSSIQKNIIPESQNDMIFAILSEELGLVGGLLFLVLYFLLFIIYIFRLLEFKH